MLLPSPPFARSSTTVAPRLARLPVPQRPPSAAAGAALFLSFATGSPLLRCRSFPSVVVLRTTWSRSPSLIMPPKSKKKAKAVASPPPPPAAVEVPYFHHARTLYVPKQVSEAFRIQFYDEHPDVAQWFDRALTLVSLAQQTIRVVTHYSSFARSFVRSFVCTACSAWKRTPRRGSRVVLGRQ